MHRAGELAPQGRAAIGAGSLRRPALPEARPSSSDAPGRQRQQCRCQAAPAQQQEAGGNAGGGGGGGGGRRGGRRRYTSSDGKSHLGSALRPAGKQREFPGPPPNEGPPLRILPIGGLGEIGMNCMLIGVYDRYILVDAGLMFPDFSDLGMQKILPDTGFLAQWRDRIEAVIITHGHEDHIGAFPWVYPALDPATPVYAGGFAMQLIKKRLQEYSLWDARRFHTFEMRQRFQLGPFECEPVRVTHSIPDCCGMVLRCEHGTIVHTGDWKIDEDPVDGQRFDRGLFEAVGNEGVSLMMSDSTNVLSQGRTTSESSVQRSLVQRVLGHQGKGRVITTQFASNLHRLAGVKAAADASGRKICFMGMSLTSYLEAAAALGTAPFDPSELVQPSAIDGYDPNELLIVTTGSQGEPRAALNLASRDASPLLRLLPSDLVLYSAKVIPGNDGQVMQMMNRIAGLGPEIAMGRHENLHTSGHAYQEELQEVLRLAKPQHFLPVHGEYAFLCAHAQLARESGFASTSVIRNGQMLGVSPRRNGRAVGGLQGMHLIGEAKLRLLYNDGGKGTGTHREMALDERAKLATEGLVVAAVDVVRPPGGRLRGRVRVTSRALWVDDGRLLEQLHKAAALAIQRLPDDAHLMAVERVVGEAIRKECRAYNRRQPEVIVIAHEADEATAAAAMAAAAAQDGPPPANQTPGRQRSRMPRGRSGAPPPSQPVQEKLMRQRRAMNPRERPGTGSDTEYA